MALLEEKPNEENKEFEVPVEKTDKKFWKEARNQNVSQSKLTIIIGSAILGIGIVLIILGINGLVNFKFGSDVLSAELENASPGVFICLLGVIVIIFGLKHSSIKPSK